MIALRVLAVLGLMLSHVSFVQAVATDDTFLSGYATGVLNHEFKLDMPPLVVKDGVITLPVGSLNAEQQSKAAQVLSGIPGVKAVKVSTASSLLILA